MPPILAFLTDFGTRDHYVGAMKGAALSICPDATLVDITHDIDPQDLLGGALALAAAFKYFPPSTIFVAVVDPGVGSERRGIAAAAHGYRFIAPDNGLLTLVLRDAEPSIVEITNAQYARARISRTFEGRDRFAPAAAWLGRGTMLNALGPVVNDWQTLDIPRAESTSGALRGEVLLIDRFGNLITNIDDKTLHSFTSGTAATVSISSDHAPLVNTYSDVPRGAMCALLGSSGYLEIAINSGNAANRVGAARGAPVVVSRA